MSGTLLLSEQLIARASVTPDDKHCQNVLIRIVRGNGRTWLDLSGLSSLELPL